MAIIINNNVSLDEHEVELVAIRAQGSGGQNVNKVSSAIHLRFDISASSLPDSYKQRLFAKNDNRITEGGIIVIKAQQSRSQLKNKEYAISRLIELIRTVATIAKKRRLTRPKKSAREKRLHAKNIRGKVKNLRRKVSE